MRAIAVWCLATMLAACDDNTPRCAPDAEVRGCFCANGRVGAQRCSDDGLRLGACMCAPDDAATDADASAADGARDDAPESAIDDAAADAPVDGASDDGPT